MEDFGKNPPRTPTSEEAWKNLNRIAEAQKQQYLGQHPESDEHGHRLDQKRPSPIAPVVAPSATGGMSGLQKNLHKAKMDKLVGGNDPREPPPMEGPRTPIGAGHKQQVEDLPRTPTSQEAWSKLTAISKAQEAQVRPHGTVEEGGMENLGSSGVMYDPREPDLPRTPVAHGHSDTAAGPAGGVTSNVLGCGAGGPDDQVRVRLDQLQMEVPKSSGDHPWAEIVLLDGSAENHVLHKETTPPATLAHEGQDGVLLWEPAYATLIDVPRQHAQARIRISVYRKKLLRTQLVGEATLPVRLLPRALSPSRPEELIKSKRGETESVGKIWLAAARD
mmetsp:Transcript_1187/g.2617  ORF Transcript_1187/g.2617 Transcript_1187/m.2617 type:complete len:333 (-) Transcript_1187:247-1245(-)|eukprot:CAMPEP_0114558730 /NCGR_PEP_ID=MMETSP0114-20121206/10541_1 /TAXON_ID=31324 /ORGANISM="Goniomonas sp, Strain m" /LENGTH=332 /DNA_ID=CAMNT_0001744147 /DNA_START=31 /DNA_END=1029 /DNA_ORIENTATION=-